MSPTKDQTATLAQTHGHALSTWSYQANMPVMANWSAHCTNPSCHVWVYIRDRDGTVGDSGVGKPCPYPVTAGDEADFIERSIDALVDDLAAKIRV